MKEGYRIMQICCVFCMAVSAYATPVSLEEAVVIGSGNHALAKIQKFAGDEPGAA